MVCTTHSGDLGDSLLLVLPHCCCVLFFSHCYNPTSWCPKIHFTSHNPVRFRKVKTKSSSQTLSEMRGRNFMIDDHFPIKWQCLCIPQFLVVMNYHQRVLRCCSRALLGGGYHLARIVRFSWNRRVARYISNVIVHHHFMHFTKTVTWRFPEIKVPRNHHPFLDGIIHEINHPALGVPPWLWKPLYIPIINHH